jgi:hypothetical protein
MKSYLIEIKGTATIYLAGQFANDTAVFTENVYKAFPYKSEFEATIALNNLPAYFKNQCFVAEHLFGDEK